MFGHIQDEDSRETAEGGRASGADVFTHRSRRLGTSMCVCGRFADDLYDYDNLAPLSSWALRMLKRFQPFVEEDARGDVQAKVGTW